MIEYIYFVKCPNCEDEHFDFFDEAKAFALGCLSKKPIITQTEVCRNDFGECTDSSDLGTIWSWEAECKDCGPDAEKAGSHILTKADLENIPERDSEFDDLDNSVEVEDEDFRAVNELAEALKESIAFKDIKDFEEFARLCREIGLKTLGDVEDFARREQVPAGQLMDKLREYRDELGPDFKIKESRKPVPDGMTIEQLVEEMEENEDMVECTWCNDLFPKDQCRKEVDLGYLCSRCEAAIKSRGEKLTFVENDYWDFLDEDAGPRDPFDHHDPDYDEDKAADYLAHLSDEAHDEKYDDAIDSLDEGFDGSQKAYLEYDDLTVTLYGNQRDADDWDEVEHSGSYTYVLDKNDVATTIWENWITEEDAADVPGGLETLEDNDAWEQFLETHFDALFDKYYDKLLDYYKESAAEEFSDGYSYYDHFDDLRFEAEDNAYDAWRDEQWD